MITKISKYITIAVVCDESAHVEARQVENRQILLMTTTIPRKNVATGAVNLSSSQLRPPQMLQQYQQRQRPHHHHRLQHPQQHQRASHYCNIAALEGGVRSVAGWVPGRVFRSSYELSWKVIESKRKISRRRSLNTTMLLSSRLCATHRTPVSMATRPSRSGIKCISHKGPLTLIPGWPLRIPTSMMLRRQQSTAMDKELDQPLLPLSQGCGSVALVPYRQVETTTLAIRAGLHPEEVPHLALLFGCAWGKSFRSGILLDTAEDFIK